MTATTISTVALVAAALVSLPASAEGKRPSGKSSVQLVKQASVILPERMCTGSVVRTTREVLTAAHCVIEGASQVTVRLPNGRETEAKLAYLDRDADLALLVLDEPATVTPLRLATQLPRRGSSLLFVGRTDRHTRPQLAKVERLGRCPSLPELSNAVFTSVDARPGDSGAPLLDSRGRVTAIVHGGARCEIAVPTAAIARVALTTPLDRAKDVDPVQKGGDSDRWVYQPTEHGFRFHWSFHWRSD